MFVSFPAVSREGWVIRDAADNHDRNMSLCSSNTAREFQHEAREGFRSHIPSLENGKGVCSGKYECAVTRGGFPEDVDGAGGVILPLQHSTARPGALGTAQLLLPLPFPFPRVSRQER